MPMLSHSSHSGSSGIKRFFSPEEYLVLESSAEERSQYVAGEIFGMTHGKPRHDTVTGNIFAGLHHRFRGRPCQAFTANIRIRATAGDLYTYPDVSALCGAPKFEGPAGQPPSLTNAQAIFEVLSPSTEAFDRGEKFNRYRRLETLRDYVLVTPWTMRVEHHWLQDHGVWEYEDLRDPGHLLKLVGVECELPLAEIYERVTFASNDLR